MPMNSLNVPLQIVLARLINKWKHLKHFPKCTLNTYIAVATFSKTLGAPQSSSLSSIPGVATQTNNYRGLVQNFHKGIDYVHIIVHIT